MIERKAKRIRPEVVIERIKNTHGDKLKMVEYGGMATNHSSFQCNICGYIWETTAIAVIKGNGCKKCGITRGINSSRLDYNFVKNYIEENNCKMLDAEYKNTKTPFLVRFECGHEGKICLDSFKRGSRCKICGHENQGLNQRIPQEKIEEILSKNNLKFIEYPTGYKNRDSTIKFVCELGHVEEHKVSVFIRDTGCSACRQIKVALEISGEKSSLWKGGLTSLTSHLKKSITKWKKDSIRNCNYKCVICSERFNDVHHLYSFYKILLESVDELNLKIKDTISEYTEIELENLIAIVVRKHYEYPLGVCLCRKHHKMFHSKYGLFDNTPEQFEEFKNNF